MTKKKEFELKDGRKVIIAEPSVSKDLKRLVEFFNNLPAEKRNVLRYNVTEVEPLKKRLEQIDGKDHWRLYAEVEAKIVADATLDRESYAWTRHVAEVRLVVAPDFSQSGVGTLLLQEIVSQGAQAGIEKLFCEVMAGDNERINQLKKAGFVREAMLRNWAKDAQGVSHNLIVMSNDLEDSWQRLANQMEELDIRFTH